LQIINTAYSGFGNPFMWLIVAFGNSFLTALAVLFNQ
jgi:hypothetical protein